MTQRDPQDFGDTVHRLYPKVLQSKWAMLILHACHEMKKAEPISGPG